MRALNKLCVGCTEVCKQPEYIVIVTCAQFGRKVKKTKIKRYKESKGQIRAKTV